MKYIIILVVLSLSCFATQVFDISQKEYEEYKQNPKDGLENLKNKYVFKKELNIKKTEKKPEIKPQIEVKDDIQKKPVVNKVQKIENNTKSETKKREMVSQKAQFKEKKVLLDKKRVIEKLQYDNIMVENDTTVLIKSISHHLKDSAVEIDSSEIKIVLEGIQKKRFTQFESKLYLEQLKNYMRD